MRRLAKQLFLLLVLAVAGVLDVVGTALSEWHRGPAWLVVGSVLLLNGLAVAAGVAWWRTVRTAREVLGERRKERERKETARQRLEAEGAAPGQLSPPQAAAEEGSLSVPEEKGTLSLIRRR